MQIFTLEIPSIKVKQKLHPYCQCLTIIRAAAEKNLDQNQNLEFSIDMVQNLYDISMATKVHPI